MPRQKKNGPCLLQPLPDEDRSKSAGPRARCNLRFKQEPARLKRLYLDGPADLVVEIISPGSRGVDRGDKFYEYEQGGVPEYWLIDPDRKQAEFYLRGEDGIHRPAPVGKDGVDHSQVLPGLWLKVDWLWQEPLPPLLDVLREWKMI